MEVECVLCENTCDDFAEIIPHFKKGYLDGFEEKFYLCAKCFEYLFLLRILPYPHRKENEENTVTKE